MVRWLVVWCVCVGVWWCPGLAAADDDVRLALLVGHERGWRNDPPLKYAVTGDLIPMARVLRRAGFRVKALQNPTAAQVRKALRWAQARVQRRPKVTTFLFYYSGHADRNAFHLGPKTSRPLTYKALVRFFRALRVRRRIALIDACFSGEIIRHFGSLKAYRQLVHKGARGIRRLNLARAFPNQGEQQGLQILTSSLNVAWESKRHKASIFTFYILKGLTGRADRDRDGKISVSELFNYASDAMSKEIRQKPMLLGLVQRIGSYALAPAYHSRLLIGPQVVGKIRVSVANFYWTQKKQRRRPLRLSVVHGKGHVEVEHNGVCRRQTIFLPKGKEARLRDRWRQVVCRQLAGQRKGAIALPVRIYVPPPRPRSWFLALSGGVQGAGALGGLSGGGQIALWHRYFGVLLGAWGSSLSFQATPLPRTQLLTSLRFAGGYHWHWGRFTLLTSGYVGAALLAQDLNAAANVGLVWQLGALIAPMVWLSERWAIELSGDVGALIGRFAGEIQPQLAWSVTLGLRFLL